MKAIITGATGFLGRHLADYLLQKNWQVIGFGRNQKIGTELVAKGVQFKITDLRNEDDVIDACEPVDVVFHCAALSSVWGKYSDFYQSNIKATEYIINACLKYNIKKLIHVSSPSIYFDYQDKINIKENDPLPKCFANNYAKTKYLAEKRVLNSPDDLEKVIIRPRGLFGEFDTSIMPRILNLLNKGYFPKFSEKDPLIDLTYVKNVAHSLYLAAITNCATQPIYNITNDEPIALYEVLDYLSEKLGIQTRYKNVSYFWADKMVGLLENLHKFTQQEPSLTRYSLGVLAKSQTLSIEKAKQELAYKPLFTLKEGIDRYVDWYQR